MEVNIFFMLAKLFYLRFFSLTVFLFAVAVAVMGHHSLWNLGAIKTTKMTD